MRLISWIMCYNLIMTNDDKILKVLEDLQAGQKALQTGQHSLQADISVLKSDVATIKDVQQGHTKRLETLEAGQVMLQADVKGLTRKVDTVELKTEAIHNYQKQAHTEIMGHLIDTIEIEARDKKILEKRIARIEKHLGLPPLK
jgi:peptidoglycan hydrolase CwlO-like protein